MIAIVFLSSTLDELLNSGFNWSVQTNLEKEDETWPKEFYIAENERTHFASDLKRRPAGIVSDARLVDTVYFCPSHGTLRIYTRK